MFAVTRTHNSVAIPLVAPHIHRQIRLLRLGVRDAVARTVAELAFGEPRDAVMMTAIASSAAEAR